MDLEVQTLLCYLENLNKFILSFSIIIFVIGFYFYNFIYINKVITNDQIITINKGENIKNISLLILSDSSEIEKNFFQFS